MWKRHEESEGLIYGEKESRRVWIDGEELTPKASQEIINHSPDGFNWGYGGSGPAQLALAVLLKFTDDPSRAFELYQQFKREFLAKAPDELRIPMQDVKAWLRNRWDE